MLLKDYNVLCPSHDSRHSRLHCRDLKGWRRIVKIITIRMHTALIKQNAT